MSQNACCIPLSSMVDGVIVVLCDCDRLYWFRPLNFHEIANRLPIFSTSLRCQGSFHSVSPSSDSDVFEISVVQRPPSPLSPDHALLAFVYREFPHTVIFVKISSFHMALQRKNFLLVSRWFLRHDPFWSSFHELSSKSSRCVVPLLSLAASPQNFAPWRPLHVPPTSEVFRVLVLQLDFCLPPRLCTTTQGSLPQLCGRFATLFPDLLAHARSQNFVCTVTQSVDLHFPALPPSADVRQLGRPLVAGSRCISSSRLQHET